MPLGLQATTNCVLMPQMQDFEIEAALQLGDVYKGASNASITFPLRDVGIKLLANSTHQGYSLTTLGRSTIFRGCTYGACAFP